jgi:hypothetical protein
MRSANSGNTSAIEEGPAELALLDEDGGQERGHGLGVGAKVKAVARRHRYVSTDSPGTDRISGHDLAVSHHAGGQRRQIVGGQIFLEGPVERDLGDARPDDSEADHRPFLDTARTGL